jgi:hypothetical protein
MVWTGHGAGCPAVLLSNMKTNISRATPLVIVIAIAAVFISAAGGAVAAGLVTSAQIQNNSIQSKDIRNGTIKVTDLSSGARLQLAGQDGQDGTQGPQGIQGVAGTNGVSGYEFLSNSVAVGVGPANGSVARACSVGKKLVGATAELIGGFEGTAIKATTTGATAYVTNVGAADTLVIYIICVSAL